MSKVIKLLSIPKTLWFNFKVFPFKTALKLPVLISYDTRIKNITKNSIVIKGDITPFMIKYNINKGSEGVISEGLTKGYLNIREGSLVFHGKANFSRGISIRVDKGILSLGKNLNFNRGCFISTSKGVKIGDNVLVGWNTSIRDSDGHLVFDLDSKSHFNLDKEVCIGDNVWIAANVDILKGVNIPNNCVIGYRSCVTREFQHENSLIAGYPAKVIKENIYWRP